MKSKEQILNEFGCPEIPFNEMVTMYYPAILSAMEEYAQQSPPTQEGESVLSSVTEDHAKEIIKAGYPAFFKSGNWHLTDESDALKEPCKKLLCKTKSFCFWFFNDKIDIDFTDGGIEATFDDINFDVRYQCYIKAAELGYNIPGLRRTPQESKEGVEDWISVVAMPDESSHNYLVPNELVDKFRELEEKYLETEDEDIVDEFNEIFSKYCTGGDINNTQLYIKAPHPPKSKNIKG